MVPLSTIAAERVDSILLAAQAARVGDLTRALRSTAEAVVDLVAPRRCVGCGEPAALLCAACAAPLAGPPFPTRPDPCPAGLPPTWAVCGYGGTTRAALVAHKEHNRLGLARPLGRALARSVAAAVPDLAAPLVLVPVPSSVAATRRRGHDPLLRCTRAAAQQLRLDGRAVTVRPLLGLRRVVDDQSGLGAVGRARNLAGAHRVRGRLARQLGVGLRLVLVDDLVTTGASLAEAARALGEAGLVATAAAVVAATQRRPRLDRPDRTA